MIILSLRGLVLRFRLLSLVLTLVLIAAFFFGHFCSPLNLVTVSIPIDHANILATLYKF